MSDITTLFYHARRKFIIHLVADAIAQVLSVPQVGMVTEAWTRD